MSVTRSEINQSLNCIVNIRFVNYFLTKLICKILKIRLVRLVFNLIRELRNPEQSIITAKLSGDCCRGLRPSTIKFWHILKYGVESAFKDECVFGVVFLEQRFGVTSADFDQENLLSCFILFTERKICFIGSQTNNDTLQEHLRSLLCFKNLYLYMTHKHQISCKTHL